MKSIELSEISALVPLVTSSASEPIFLTRDGETVAAVVPTSEEEAESLLLSINPKFQEILERSEHRLKNEGGIKSGDVRKKLGLPPNS